jgi:hypothetical protein
VPEQVRHDVGCSLILCLRATIVYIDAVDTVMPLVIGFLILGRSFFALISGSASSDNKGLLRDEEPIIYWITVIAGFAIAIGLFIFAWRNWHGV